MVQTHRDFSLKPPLNSPKTWFFPETCDLVIQGRTSKKPKSHHLQQLNGFIVKSSYREPDFPAEFPVCFGFRTLADATPKETKRLWSRSRENHEMNLHISQFKILPRDKHHFSQSKHPTPQVVPKSACSETNPGLESLARTLLPCKCLTDHLDIFALSTYQDANLDSQYVC